MIHYYESRLVYLSACSYIFASNMGICNIFQHEFVSRPNVNNFKGLWIFKVIGNYKLGYFVKVARQSIISYAQIFLLSNNTWMCVLILDYQAARLSYQFVVIPMLNHLKYLSKTPGRG